MHWDEYYLENMKLKNKILFDCETCSRFGEDNDLFTFRNTARSIILRGLNSCNEILLKYPRYLCLNVDNEKIYEC